MYQGFVDDKGGKYWGRERGRKKYEEKELTNIDRILENDAQI